MTAPTLQDFQISTWAGQDTNDEVTPTVTWLSGDVVIVVGATEDNATAQLNTPTATGLTFSLVLATNTINNCKLYVWSATAGSSSSSAITATRADANSKMRGIAAYVYRGSSGVGNTGTIVGDATTNAVISLVRGSDNSAVVVIMGDWTPVNDTTVTANPSSGGTVRGIVNSAGATLYTASWTDQGAAGTSSYGIGSYTATPKWAGIAVEIKGSAAAGGIMAWPTFTGNKFRGPTPY